MELRSEWANNNTLCPAVEPDAAVEAEVKLTQQSEILLRASKVFLSQHFGNNYAPQILRTFFTSMIYPKFFITMT